MFRFLLCLAVTLFSIASRAADYDVVIYGGTSGGVIAAIQGSKMGKSVMLIEPGEHLGGLTSGGLGADRYRQQGGYRRSCAIFITVCGSTIKHPNPGGRRHLPNTPRNVARPVPTPCGRSSRMSPSRSWML